MHGTTPHRGRNPYIHGMANRRVGIWVIGAFGNVGASVALGLAALRRGLCSTTGLVTAMPEFESADLDAPTDFVFGGHDVRPSDLATEAAAVGGARPAFPSTLVEQCRRDLTTWSDNVRPGLAGTRPREAAERLRTDWSEFTSRHELSQLVVINLASTEAVPTSASEWPTSAHYAMAAVEAGLPYVNFTPSIGADLPGILAQAERNGVPVAGSDGKTGEDRKSTRLNSSH